MATSLSSQNVGLEYGSSKESGDSNSRLVQESKSNVLDSQFELTLRHVNGEAVFWDGGYDLKSNVTIKVNSTTAFPLPIETVLGKYLAADYFQKDEENQKEIFLVNGNFQPLSLEDHFGSLFQEGGPRATIFIRSRDFSGLLTPKKSELSSRSDVNTNYEMQDVIAVTLEEVSGRRILWDDKNKVFDSLISLQVARAALETTRVDSILSRILAKNYFLDTNTDALHQQIWTDKVKVVGLKDTLDVLCRSSNKIKIYLKHIRNSEDLQWQEILDAISQFKEKVGNTDEDLRSYYQANHVFEDMEELKRQIQSDNRNEEVIQSMMLQLEPKLNLALSFISTIEESERDPNPSSDMTDIPIRPSDSKPSQSSRYEECRVSFQFYHW